MAIAADLIAKMQGRLWIESELGCGSTFFFTARFGVQSGLPEPAAARPFALDGLRNTPVLVVDDNPENREVLGEYLTDWGLQPVFATNGHAALDQIRLASAAGKRFPLIILDALMPGLDGFTVAERIRSDPRLAAPTILMLSAADRQRFSDCCKDLAIAAYLEKPVSQAQLLKSIIRALALDPCLSDASSRVAASIASPPAPLKILLVEDTPANQKLISKILQKRGHTLEIAPDGAEAVKFVERDNFDAVLMDVQMPVLDGFQATAAIRALNDAEKSRIPVIAMTAHAMQGDRERCLAAGMDGYLTKPINSQALIQTVESTVATLHEPEPLTSSEI